MTKNEIKEVVAETISELEKTETKNGVCPVGLKQSSVETLNDIATVWERGSTAIKWSVASIFALGILVVFFTGVYHKLKTFFETYIR
jgi:hypothetical protein